MSVSDGNPLCNKQGKNVHSLLLFSTAAMIISKCPTQPAAGKPVTHWTWRDPFDRVRVVLTRQNAVLRVTARGVAIWVGAWVLALSLTARLAADEPRTLRVLTYNIHHGEGMDGKLDLRRIAEVIQRAKPDVVALQEVDAKTGRAQGVDQAAELGKLTGLHSAFGQAMEYDGGAYGEAFLSRWPLEDVRVIALPKREGSEPRCILAARVQPDNGLPAFVFASTHLEHAKAQLCLCQAGKLGPYLANSEGLPVILAGDLNAEFESAPLVVLQRPS